MVFKSDTQVTMLPIARKKKNYGFYEATEAAVSQNSGKGQAQIMQCDVLRLADPRVKKNKTTKQCSVSEEIRRET